jgi:hypothetical protein
MATAPGSNERRYCAGGAAIPDSLAARVALKDQQKMAPVDHTYWESTALPRRRLADSAA